MSTLLIVALILAAVAGLAFLIGDLIVVTTSTISTRELPNITGHLADTADTDADIGAPGTGTARR